MKNGKKIVAGILMGGLLASTGALVGCGSNPPADRTMENATDVYGFAGATTGMLMGNDSIQGAMIASSSISAMEDGDVFSELKNQIDTAISSTLDQYMGVFDSVVGGEKPVNVVQSASDKMEYRHKLTITTTSIDGNEMTCILHFNETKNNDQDEVLVPNEEKGNTHIVGELYLNGSTTPFYVEGWREKDAQDNEMEFRFEARLNKNSDLNMVSFEQEISNEGGEYEEEYKFTVTIGGVSREFEFELEKSENGKIEVEYELEVGEHGKIAFDVEKTANDTITIKTSSLIPNQELEISVRVERSQDQTQQRYIYTNSFIGLEVQGEWRAI
ncbi:MAG: hypothetical protein J6J24_02550 [Clostridia bacterium]|nr:hypothetical protein [Clostridia bacterium]